MFSQFLYLKRTFSIGHPIELVFLDMHQLEFLFSYVVMVVVV